MNRTATREVTVITYTEMQNIDDRLAGEFEIEADDVDGSCVTLALCSVGNGAFAPQIRCFDDALPTLMAFFLAGGAKALAWEGSTASGFAHALRRHGFDPAA